MSGRQWSPLKLIAIVSPPLQHGLEGRPYHKSPQTKTCDRTAFLDDPGRGLGRHAQAVLATTRRPFQRQARLGERLLTHAAPLGTTTGMVLMGGVGLGVG